MLAGELDRRIVFELTTAAAKSDSASPLIYLLTPSQMLDNDYRLPSYIDPSSDVRVIPGLDSSALGPELSALLKHKEDHGDMTSVPVTYSMSSRNGEKKNGLKSGDEGSWVETAEATSPPPGSDHAAYPILAMDCEMVRPYTLCEC